MYIKRLIVKKTKPSETIRDIPFKLKGLNLIVDNTGNVSNESGNSVGKTTAIKIIDLCLGAKSVRDLYYDSDTKSQNDNIKDFLIDNKVQAELHLLSSKKEEIIICRDLFPNGKRYIDNKPYTQNEFGEELKKIIFKSEEKYPTFRQLISKFIRVSNTSQEGMIKFLPGRVSNATYDSIYSFLFKILNNELVSTKNDLNSQLADCQKAIKMLEKSQSISSISILRQKKELLEREIDEYSKKRNELSYIDDYKEELEKKRNLTSKIKEVQDKRQLLEFEINTINDSLSNLAKEQVHVDTDVLEQIYKETQKYIPAIQKDFRDLLNFHNKMIQNRIDYISRQLKEKTERNNELSGLIDSYLKEKQKITIEVLDEGLLDELNLLNNKIEKLSEQSGEIIQSINILEEQEKNKNELTIQIEKIEKEIDDSAVDMKMKAFNDIFSKYCEELYGEKYVLAYDAKWKEKKIFPISLSSFEGNVGTGKKKAVIVAFDLAYLKYAENMNISCPQFVIHDRLENTHINQLKTIFDICKQINGQYIIPILRERIDKVDSQYVESSTILELSTKNKFFKV